MGRKSMHLILMAVVMATLFCFMAGAAFGADKIRWKGQTCFGLASPLGKHTIVLWKKIVEEMMVANVSERTTRVIDFDQDASMEQKKREGYF